MRIIIETEGSDAVSVSRDGPEKALESAEATDGGGPPEALLQALSDEPAMEPEETEAGEPSAPDDGGEAPAWLVDVIEGASAPAPDGSTED